MNSAENIGLLPLQSSDSDAVSNRTLTTTRGAELPRLRLHAHDGLASAALEQRLVSHEAAADEALETRCHALEIVLGDDDRADDERAAAERVFVRTASPIADDDVAQGFFELGELAEVFSFVGSPE